MDINGGNGKSLHSIIQKQMLYCLFVWLTEPLEWEIRIGLFIYFFKKKILMILWCYRLPKYVNRTLFDSKIIFQMEDINQSFNRFNFHSIFYTHNCSKKIKLLNSLFNFFGYFSLIQLLEFHFRYIKY